MIEKMCERAGCTNIFPVDETHVGKKKQYCSGRCRQIVSRQNKEREQRDLKERHIVRLRQTWQQFSPEIRAKLEEVMRYSDNWTAQKATDALLLQLEEMKALARLKYTEGFEAGRKQTT